MSTSQKTKVGVLTIAYNEEDLIGACVKQFLPYQLHHVVLVSAEPWGGEVATPDNTIDIATALGADVVCGKWESEAAQRNYGIELLKDCDWVLIVDADEFYTPVGMSILSEDIKMPANILRTENMEVYWHDRDHRVTPKQVDSPIVAVRPMVRFTEKRQAHGNTAVTSATLHHLSYVRSDEAMWKKISTFEHRYEFDIKEWYDNVWKTWDSSRVNLHPTNPEQFAQAVYNPVPEEIEALFV